MSPTGTMAEAARQPVVPVRPTQRTASTSALLPLSVHGLCYRIGSRELLHDISFELGNGHLAMIMGPNGAGKTMLLRLCHGLIRPSAGGVHWNGLTPNQAGQRLSMVFQKPVLLRRSVFANVTFALKIKGLDRAERKHRAWEALEQTALTHLAKRPARRLSGGERQRVAIARAMALKPDVLLLDEPTANLDPHSTLAVEKLVRTIRAAGTKVVMTTHDLAQARRLGQEILFLNHGHLLEQTPADRFFEAPRTREAAAFLEGKLLL